MTCNVGIYLFDDVEVLDFAGPFEVFSTASRVKRQLEPQAPTHFRVFTVAKISALVKARGGLQVLPDFDFSNHPEINVLVVPGGVVSNEVSNANVIAWILGISKQSLLTLSVCTGAFLLAEAGLLNNKEVTTHWEDVEALRATYPAISVREGTRWCDSGSIITSAGISAGIDMSLHAVERLAGRDLALRTARQMEFDWNP